MEKKTNWFKLIGQILLWYLIVFFLTQLSDLTIGLGAAAAARAILPASAALETASLYIPFIGTWTGVLLFLWMSRKNRPILKALGTKPRGNNWKMFLFGLLLGFGMNGFVALVAIIKGDISLHFDSFHPISFLLVFVCVFVQSSAEELYDRGVLFQKFMQLSGGKPAVAMIASALFFSVMHVFNPNVTLLSLINILAVGVFYALMVYYTDSIWLPMAHHTAWNFTQNILLGLPNSGNVVPYSVFKVDAASATSSFVYDVGFGIEGSLFTALMLIASCVILYLWGKKHGKKPLNVWAA